MPLLPNLGKTKLALIIVSLLVALFILSLLVFPDAKQQYESAVKSLDENRCSQISDSKYQCLCYYEIGKAKGDESLCAKAGGGCGTYSNSKYGPAFGDITITIDCYVSAAAKTGDYSICSRTPLGPDMWNFTSDCYRDLALKVNDSSVCNYIRPDDVTRGLCYHDFGLKN
ncbi:Uncharacterised protein [Candidatus Gugararchaeum adminiculabundum]|nr:Uncharacterised protein [Candidatus Gugararchaeum adminiculabundum]